MAQLPYYQSTDQVLNLLQTKWRGLLNPFLGNTILNGNQIKNVNLVVGSTNISHGLSRVQQGWFLTDINGAAQVYRSQPFNNTTLNLSSNAAVTVSVWCY